MALCVSSPKRRAERFAITENMKVHRADTPHRMIEMVDKYSADEFVILDDTSEYCFAYDLDADAVVINTQHPQYPYQDYGEAMIHELAHRIDQYEFGSPMNQQFSNAIKEAEKRFLTNADAYNKMFDEGGNLEYNNLISDILGCITDNVVVGNSYHDSQYIGTLGYTELEVFANLFSVLYQGDDETVKFVKEELQEVYKTFLNILGIIDAKKRVH